MKFILRIMLTATAIAVAAPAAGQMSPQLTAAKQAGIVGERFDGYLGYRDTRAADVQRQVGAVNIKRRSLYTGLAIRRNATVQEVGIAAGCELLGQVKVGEIYMLDDGKWHRRSAGEAAPVPGYCGR